MAYAQLGSWLHPDAVRLQRDLNFLHPAAYQHAEQRSIDVQKEGGSLEPKRLFHNMLSSMPMCFNLFGAMRGEPGFLPVFQRLFDPRANAILDVVCEWTPAEPDDRLGDRTAFDAVVFYETADGPAFFGIETKYTEPFSRKVYQPSEVNRYREVTHESGWFAAPATAIENLQGPASNQLWRNTMLAARLEQCGHHGRGSVAVVALADDPGATKACDIVVPALTDSHVDRLRLVTAQEILAVTEQVVPDLSWWVTSFRRRYVDHSLPGRSAEHGGHDPLGPVMGRSIADTATAARHNAQPNVAQVQGEE